MLYLAHIFGVPFLPLPAHFVQLQRIDNVLELGVIESKSIGHHLHRTDHIVDSRHHTLDSRQHTEQKAAHSKQQT